MPYSNCWGFLTDNGQPPYMSNPLAGSTPVVGPTFFNSAARTQEIPLIADSAMTQDTLMSLIDEVQSRLWVYDAGDNVAWNAGTFTHRGRGLGVGAGTLSVGCSYNVGHLWDPGGYWGTNALGTNGRYTLRTNLPGDGFGSGNSQYLSQSLNGLRTGCGGYFGVSSGVLPNPGSLQNIIPSGAHQAYSDNFYSPGAYDGYKCTQQPDFTNVSINTYRYDIGNGTGVYPGNGSTPITNNTNNEHAATGFTKTPLTTYRIVDKDGYLLGAPTADNFPAGTQPRHPSGDQIGCGSIFNGGNNCLGDGFTYISDNEFLVTTINGVWYTNTKWKYAGSSVKHRTKNNAVASTPAAPGNDTRIYVNHSTGINDLSSHSYSPNPGLNNNWNVNMGRTFEDAWYACSYETGHKVETLIAVLVADLSIISEAMGDQSTGLPMDFDGATPSFPVIPTGAITFINAEHPEGLPPTCMPPTTRRPQVTLSVQYADMGQSNNRATTSYEILLPLTDPAMQNVSWVYNGNNAVDYVNSLPIGGVGQNATLVNSCPGAILPTTMSGATGYLSTWSIPENGASDGFEDHDWFLIGTNINPDQTPSNSEITRYVSAINSSNNINGTIFQSPHHENYDSPPSTSHGAGEINFKAWGGPGNPYSTSGPSVTFPFGNLAGAKAASSLQFWGVGQCPSCVYTSIGNVFNIGVNPAGNAFDNTTLEGHYECSIHGCISSWGLGEVTPQFTSFAACSAACISYSCTSTSNPLAYSCPPIIGTGQTGTWLDEEDCDNNCGPQYHICTPIGCSGTTDTTAPYSSFTHCFEGGFGQPACESFGCEDNGCLRQDGTGGTYTTMTACTGTCFSYACQDGSCQPWNEPWYGSGGTYFDVRSPLSALTACTASTIPCVAWACGSSYIPVNTDIYVYYDTTSMSLSNAQVAHNSIEQWAAQMPGYVGTIRHINIADERWVSWATIPYQQPTPKGLRCGYPATPIRRPQELRAWSQLQPSANRWYDSFDPGCNPSFVVNGVTHSFVGYPPLINPNKNVLNVLFTDESDSHYPNPVYYDVNRTFTTAPEWDMNPDPEPSPQFKDDYTRYMSVWNNVQSAAGTIASFVYPTKPVNYNLWGSGTVSVFKYQALSIVAAIDSGNNVPQDGKWSGGTAPRRAGQGGVVSCTNSTCATLAMPPLCSICDLTQLEASNVYWNGLTPTWGGLDKFGWGYNASFPQLTWQQMQTDLETFISSPVIIGSAGCSSATTSPNAVYPYSGLVACLDFCDPKYECLPNGCVLNSTGGTYDTMASCTAACQSYSCSTVGCELWNPPNYGTGGTFIDLVSCDVGCTSWNCEDVGANNPSVDGCIKQVGTGGTYFNASNLLWGLTACTATCTSWDCMYTPSQCTEYPNTGFTYSTSAACEASPACGGGWECTISGCILHPGTPPSGPNFYPNSGSCIEHCVGWGCSADTIPANTNIYAYYTTDPHQNWSHYRDWLPSAHTTVMNWVATIPGFTGKVYHTVSSNERWMGYANSVYTGELPGGLITYNPSASPATSPCGVPPFPTPPVMWGHVSSDTMWMINYGAQQVDAAYWYDDITPGQYPWTLGTPITAKGLPPTAHTSANTLVLVFQKDATGNPWLDTISDCGDNYFIPNNMNSPNGYWYGSGAYHNGQGFTSGGLYPGRVPQFSGGSVMTTYQPTNAWKKDYTAFTVNYSAVTGNSGTFKGFMFTPPRGNVPNFTGGPMYTTPIHQSAVQTNFPLHSLGAITRGNNNVADGQYILGTAPRMSAAGGIHGGVPEICGGGTSYGEFGVVLSQLELINPYWNQPAGTSYGRLYEKNWGIDITYEPWSDQRFTNALEPFLQSVSAAIITGTCVSAETLYTVSTQYPYSSETWCTGQCGSSEWLYVCTPTGCTQHPDGIMTLSECLNGGIVIGGVDYSGCISYSCGTQGCQLYNQPPTPPTPGINYYGTGGTFSAAFGPGELYRCWQMCGSFACNWDPSYMSYDDEGCKGVIGTGATNTFLQLSACTGTCRSWDCNNPCDLQNIYAQYRPSGCTEYPNTGSTYTSSTACTDSCIRNWFCYSGSGIYNITPQNGPFGSFPGAMANFSCATAVDIVPAVNDFSAALDLLHANNGFGVTNWPYKPIGTWRFSQLINNSTPFAQHCDSPYGGWLRISKALSVSQLGGATYETWNDFITAAQTIYPSITLSHTPSSILGIMNEPWYLQASTNCLCSQGANIPCSIDCSNTWPVINTPSNPTPPAGATIFNGPYVTYSAASGVCCTGITVPTTSWSCKTGTEENSCDGLTLIPMSLTTVHNCYNWLTTNFPGGMFSAYTCELASPPTTSTDCVGPNGGQLVNLTTMQFQTDLNSSVTGFSNWNNFISHASTQLSPAVTNIISGQDIYTLEVNTYDVYCDGNFYYNTTGCTCTETACGCVELQNASGPYTSQTHCQLSCCTSGTSWNCVNTNVPYHPICTGKTFVGEFNTDYSALDYYRVNAPSSIFGLDRLVVNQPVTVGAGGNHLTMAEAMSNVGLSTQVENCYYEDFVNYPMPPGSPNPGIYFKPYKYINEISHTLVNGGFGYHTWNSWRAAVVTEGVTLLVNDTAYDVCTKINAQLNAGNTPIPCNIRLDNCCRPANCYCYELFITGGTYSNEPDCLTVCCPPPNNYECTPPQPGQSQGFCIPTSSPIGPNVYPSYTLCVSACTGTTWHCFPGGSVAQVGGSSDQAQIPDPGGYPGYYSTTSDCSNKWQDLFVYVADWQAVPTRQYDLLSAYTTCLETTPPPPASSLCACGTCGQIYGTPHLIIRWSCSPNSGPYSSYQNTGLYNASTNPLGMPSTWAEVIEQLQNVIAPTGTFTLTMSYAQVEAEMQAHANPTLSPCTIQYFNFIPWKESCIETVIPCDCYPCYHPNVCAYTSYTQCIIPCCPITAITYNCTINGCVDPLDGTGTFHGTNALIDCQHVCWEWECDPGTSVSQNCNNLIDLHPVYGPVRYDYGFDFNPPWLTPTWVQGGTKGNLIIDLFGNPNTLPAPHNHLNGVTGMFNLQEQALSHYTLDSTLGWPSALTGMSTTNWCDSLHGKRWRPQRIGILNRTTRDPLSPSSPYNYTGPWTTYYGLIKWLVYGTDWCSDQSFPSGACMESSLLLEPWDINNRLITTHTVAIMGAPQYLLNGELWLYGEPCLC